MRRTFDNSPEFRRLLSGDEAVDLTRLSLEIAQDLYPDLDNAAYLIRLDALAERVRDRCPSGAKVRQILGQINWVLFVEESFRGNDESYYDPRNSFLNEVLDRKLGIPISLSVIYMAVADRLGLALSGVNLPAHFIVRSRWGSDAVFVDPYHGGTLMDRQGCQRLLEQVTGQGVELTDEQLAPCSPVLVVRRMLHNLKAVYLRENDFVSALPILRRLTALSGDDPIERRDLGVACLHADRPAEALDHLDAYLTAFPRAPDSVPVASLLKVAQREVASWN
ncbi:MAG TPA: transglutaminase-like domain-containing protein [Isosphaeraceae bacterium]|nr:transglutaminase-like domain-containing protein [Isosphaeraceae bacterium]